MYTFHQLYLLPFISVPIIFNRMECSTNKCTSPSARSHTEKLVAYIIYPDSHHNTITVMESPYTWNKCGKYARSITSLIRSQPLHM